MKRKGKQNYEYIIKEIKSAFAEVESNEVVLVDVLIQYLYQRDNIRKVTLWECYGDIINQNLKYNLTKKYGEKSKPCIICGERIEITRSSKMFCEICLSRGILSFLSFFSLSLFVYFLFLPFFALIFELAPSCDNF